MSLQIKLLESSEEITAVEELQRLVWPGSDLEIVPAHILITAIHNGGVLIGAYSQDDMDREEQLVGFVFGFPGFYETPTGMHLKHCSHMLGVRPGYRDSGIGFALKRAQWQMVRHQGLDQVTWTYDPLQSRNANLNITKLGAVCNTYLREVYGEMRDGLNVGVPSDRFQVDWWVNSNRVLRKLSKRPRVKLDFAHYLAAGAEVINPSQIDERELPRPSEKAYLSAQAVPMILVEIPANYPLLKDTDLQLALVWRLHTRQVFEDLFAAGYLVTDFIYLPGSLPRSFYVLSHGESTL